MEVSPQSVEGVLDIMVAVELGAFKEMRYKGKTLDVRSGDVSGDVEVRPSQV